MYTHLISARQVAIITTHVYGSASLKSRPLVLSIGLVISAFTSTDAVCTLLSFRLLAFF